MSARLTGALVAMAALLAAGLSTGARVYYLLLILLAAMLLLGLASALWTVFTLRVEMKGVRPRVKRGETLMTVFTVRHASLLPVASVRVQLSVPSSLLPEQEISVCTPPFVARSFRHRVPCPHRGVYEAGVTRVAARDMFGFFSISRRPGGKLLRVEVVPNPAPASELPLAASDVGPEFFARAAEDNASPSDIRAWQEGDSLKKVHWKLSMRRREVVVRTYEESARPDTLIIPDLSSVTALKDRQLSAEDAVCEACLGAAKAQLEAGDPVRMPLTSAEPSEVSGHFPADLPAFADALMRVRFDSPYAYEQVLALMLARMQRTGGAVLATARLTTRVADLAMRMQRSGIRTRLVWATDDPREESLEMLERLKMEGVEVQRAELG